MDIALEEEAREVSEEEEAAMEEEEVEASVVEEEEVTVVEEEEDTVVEEEVTVEEEEEGGAESTDPVNHPTMEEAEASVAADPPAMEAEGDTARPDRPHHTALLSEMISQAAEAHREGRPMTTTMTINHHAKSENNVVIHSTLLHRAGLVLRRSRPSMTQIRADCVKS